MNLAVRESPRSYIIVGGSGSALQIVDDQLAIHMVGGATCFNHIDVGQLARPNSWWINLCD